MRGRRYAQENARRMKGLGSLEEADMLYYNIGMSDHGHHHHHHGHHHHGHHHHGHHHHHAGHAHPPAAVRPSILRLSALQRLGIAGGLIALLWLAAFWAMR